MPKPSSKLSAFRERTRLVHAGRDPTEQHGFHLPVNTDTVIIDAITQGVVDAIPGEAEALPTLPYGVSRRDRRRTPETDAAMAYAQVTNAASSRKFPSAGMSPLFG